MTEVKRTEGYTEEQIKDARRFIDVLMSVPENRRPIVTAVATAYIDGIEAGTRITEGNRRKAITA